MKLENKALYYSRYFIILLLITISWIFLLPEPYDIYGPLVFTFLGYTLFFYLFIKQLFSLSQIVKKRMPDFFERHSIDYGFLAGKLLSGFTIWNNKNAYLESGHEDVKQHFLLLKQLFKLTMISFLLAILLFLALILFKR